MKRGHPALVGAIGVSARSNQKGNDTALVIWIPIVGGSAVGRVVERFGASPVTGSDLGTS